MARLQAHERTARLIRLATAGALIYSVLWQIIDVAFIFVLWHGGGPRNGIVALVGTALFLPLYVWHIWCATRGTRPPGGAWTLAVMAVIIIGALPLAGPHWFRMFGPLAVSALLVMRRPWSWWTVGALIAVPLPGSLAWDISIGEAFWHALGVPWRASAMVVLVWLATAVRRLHEGQLALAQEAVERERARIDGELERTLGAALESIVARGQRASALIGRDDAASEAGLRALVDSARTTLADARRMIGSYRQVSLRAELEAAATLLSAAGIETRLVIPRGDFPDAQDRLRVELRAATSRVLRDETVRRCVITLAGEGERLRLEVVSDARMGVRSA